MDSKFTHHILIHLRLVFSTEVEEHALFALRSVRGIERQVCHCIRVVPRVEIEQTVWHHHGWLIVEVSET